MNVLIIALLCFVCSTTFAQVKYTDGWKWVDVMNPHGITSGNVVWSFGESCGIDNGATLVWIDRTGDDVLVEYQIDCQALGTLCPSGTLFWIRFSDWERYRRAGKKAAAEQWITVNVRVDSSYHGPMHVTVDEYPVEVLLTVDLKQYLAECYADSTSHRVHTTRNLFSPCLFDWECTASHYEIIWTHRTPTLEGFMKYLDKH